MTFLAIRTFLGGLPRGVWIFLAGALLIAAGAWWHSGKVKAYGAEQYQAGRDSRDAEIIAAQKRVEEANARVTAEIRKRTDEENRRIAADATNLRLSGPGRAGVACPPVRAGGHSEAGGNADAPGPGVYAGDFAAVPWPWLVERAEQSDLNRSEVLAWREWHERLAAEWGRTN
jgi:hypothetical protein